MFQFKQFSVDQAGCAMKINTDGVLLGAIAGADNPATILDIGTGTGVIALMLAQRFTNANIDTVEIDALAAKTAAGNFSNSVFNDRINIFPMNYESFLDEHLDNKYDVIISNPPFHINSLESPEEKRSLAKHTDASFFEVLMKDVSEYLTEKGHCWLILHTKTSTLARELASQNGLYLHQSILVRSFAESKPHREIVCFGLQEVSSKNTNLTIYEAKGIYSDEYKNLLKPYFLAF